MQRKLLVETDPKKYYSKISRESLLNEKRYHAYYGQIVRISVDKKTTAFFTET